MDYTLTTRSWKNTTQNAEPYSNINIDTNNYPVDESLPAFNGPIESGVGVDLPWQAVWRNPADYTGDGGVIIPYRFQSGGYTAQQMADIDAWLAELSGYLGGCVAFIDDTSDKKYATDYIYVRSQDDNGVFYKGICNSFIGNITKFYKMENQELKLSVAQRKSNLNLINSTFKN